MARRSTVGIARQITASVVTNSVQTTFADRLWRARRVAKILVIASPWLSGEGAGRHAFERLTRAIATNSIPTYVFTRDPNHRTHKRALEALADCSSVEIVLNNNLHAKVYACLAPYPYAFALLGSANLTDASASNYEIGLIVMAAGGGEETVKELAGYGLHYLRTRPESRVYKRMGRRS